MRSPGSRTLSMYAATRDLPAGCVWTMGLTVPKRKGRAETEGWASGLGVAARAPGLPDRRESLGMSLQRSAQAPTAVVDTQLIIANVGQPGAGEFQTSVVEATDLSERQQRQEHAL